VHSPFVYDFIESILNDHQHYYAYHRVEHLRSDLMTDSTSISIEDLGAGSYKSATRIRTVRSIAKTAAKPKKYAQLLFRIVNRYQSQQIVELGTSLGLTTSYLSLANNDAMVHTLEGAEKVALEAESNFRQLGLKNVRLIKGNFDKTLPELLKLLPYIDFAFIDGNHRKEPTVRYFNQLLASRKEESVFVFDDIHWSEEMQEAWEEVKRHEAVMLTVDLFFVGIVFFNSSFKVKQHFRIRF